MKYPFNEQKTSLSTARAWVLSNTDKGVTCPCCDQLAKRYRRTLHASMASALIQLFKFQKRQAAHAFFHAPSVLAGVTARGGDFAKLVYWRLIDVDLEERPGFYRVTQAGEEFVECRSAVASAVYLYNGEVVGWDTKDLITIVDAIGDASVYEELMEKD